MSGGGKKTNSGYYYFLGWHMVLCQGPVDSIEKIISDDKLAWEGVNTGGPIVIYNLNLYGGPTKEGGLAGQFDVQMGEPTQTVNSYLNTVLAGNLVPAYRGVVGIVAHQVYVGTTTYLKKFGVVASRMHVRTTDGIEQWYDAKAELAGVNIPSLILAARGTKLYYNGLIDDTWGAPNETSVSSEFPLGIGSITALDDRYLLFDGEKVYTTIDGVTLVAATPLTSGTSAAAKPIWDPLVGIIVIPREIGSVAYSLDKGTTWIELPGAPYLYKIVKCGITYIGYNDPTLHWWSTSNPTGGWTDNGAQTQFGSGGTCAAGNGSTAMIGGPDSGFSQPVILQTTSGSSFITETLPTTIGYLPIAMAWNPNGTWGCLVVGGSQAQVIYRTASIWAVGLTLGSGVTAFNLEFLPAANCFVLSTSAGSQFSTDLVVWSSVPSSGLSSGTYPNMYADGVQPPAGTTPDMNPIHIIRECLTDPDWGMGYLDADIDDDNFRAAADKLWIEGMGMSLLWNKEATIEDFIREVIKHIDATLFVDRSTGKFNIKLIRPDYVFSSLPRLDESNIDHIADFTQPRFGELTTSITVNYWNGTRLQNDSLKVQDSALAQMQQAEINVTIDYPGFTNIGIASRAAQRDLVTMSTAIISCTIYTQATDVARLLNIGSPFRCTWPDYNMDQLVMRVVGIAFGDGKSNKIRITATQDIYSTPSFPVIAPPAPYVPPSTDPVPTTVSQVFEVPYLEAVQRQGQSVIDGNLATDPEIGYVGAAATRPASFAINADMQTDPGTGYASRASLDYCPYATLDASIGKTDVTFDLLDGVELDLVEAGSWFQVGEEIMVFVSYAAPTVTVKRGALDTVPEAHAAGDDCFFWDTRSAADPTQYADGESVDVKLLTTTFSGTLPIASAAADTVVLGSRMIRPYAPGQFKINSSYYPASLSGVAITVTWVHRDRLLQTGSSYLGMTDAGVGPEPGTTYTVRIYDDTATTLLNTESGISGTTSTAYTPPSSTNIRVELEAVCAGNVSFQKHTHILAYTVASTGDRRLTEDGDVRITEASDTRIVE